MDCLSTQRLIPPKRAITAFFCYQRERKKTIKEENNNCLMPNYSYIDDPDTDGDKVPFFENYHLLKIN